MQGLYLSIYEPCRSKLAIMSVQVLLSFDACSTSHVFKETLIRVMILLIDVIFCQPIASFPAIFPIIAKYSISPLLCKVRRLNKSLQGPFIKIYAFMKLNDPFSHLEYESKLFNKGHAIIK